MRNNLRNPETYSEPCQPSDIEYFAKTVNIQKQLTSFVKHSILDVWQSFEYTYVICYSLFGKTEDANNTV